MTALIVIAYPTVRDNSSLDKTFSGLPAGVQASLGLGDGLTLTSPAGYLNSQFLANVLPIILLIFAIGIASSSTGGDEEAGYLELLLSNPVSRTRVAIERATGMAILLAIITAVAAATLVVLAPVVDLTHGVSVVRMVESVACAGLMALTFAALTFCAGTATGRKSFALTIGASLAVAGFIVEGLGAQVGFLRPVRAIVPWHWFLDSNPLVTGFRWQSWALPIAVTIVAIAAGTRIFARRDLRAS